MIPYCIAAIQDESDREFMTRVFLQYQRLMYQRILLIVNNKWDADDVLQEVLEQLMKKVDKLRGLKEHELAAYIVTACENRAVNSKRYVKNHSWLLLDESCEVPDRGTHKDAIESRLIKEDEVECFLRLWNKLDWKTQYILKSIYILERSEKELAEEFGEKPGSFRMQVSRIRKKTFAQFQEAYEKGE